MIMDNHLKVNHTDLKAIVNKHLYSVTTNRLEPYIVICKHMLIDRASYEETLAIGICVYTTLQQRSSIFFSLIQEIEISVRNQISNFLNEQAKANKLSLENYFCFLAFDSRSQLSKKSKQQLKKSIVDTVGYVNAQNKRTVLTSIIEQNKNCNNIISSLTFGFWVYLFNPKNQAHFVHWSNVLGKDKIFDGRFNSSKEIFVVLQEILLLRNKLFHQEAIWKGKNITSPEKALSNLKRKYESFSNYLLKIAPERYEIRQRAKWQVLQTNMNFDLEVFNEEIKYLYESTFLFKFPKKSL